jgi:hypothetical protein
LELRETLEEEKLKIVHRVNRGKNTVKSLLKEQKLSPKRSILYTTANVA